MGAEAVNTADLYDERGEDLQSIAIQFQSLGGRTHFNGPARTVRCSADKTLLKSPDSCCILASGCFRSQDACQQLLAGS